MISIPVITFKPFWGSVVQSILVEDVDVLNSYMGSLTFSKDVLQTIYPDSAQWMTFGIAWLSFTGIGFLIYAVNQLSGKYRLGSIVASFLFCWIQWCAGLYFKLIGCIMFRQSVGAALNTGRFWGWNGH